MARAAKHLKAIKRSIAAYGAKRPYRIVKAKVKKTKNLSILKPPDDIAVLAGEMIYQMRSALDHLAFELVKHNSASLPTNWEETCEFPLRTRPPRHGKPPVPYSPPAPLSEFSRQLPGVPITALTFIETLQPYYGTPAVNNFLGVLAKLSNIDKHRYLNVVSGKARQSQTVRYRSGFSMRSVETLDHGAELPPETGINKSDRAVYVNRRFRPFVTFGEPSIGGFNAYALDYLLQLILENIEAVVVPALHKFIKKP